MMKTFGKYSGFLIAFVFGVLVGGYVFRDVQPRSVLAVDRCEDSCLSLSDAAGLAASVGIGNLSGVLPTVMETDKTMVFKHPSPEAPVHLVVVPKKDIKDIGELSHEEREYLVDAFAVMQALIEERDLKEYRILTNGPEFQHVAYLHFHLRAK